MKFSVVRRFSAACLALACASPSDAVALDAESRKAVARIDAAIAKNWDDQGVEPRPPLSDEGFVRRIYLDAVGRIPSAIEAATFLDSEDPKKREKLIDELVDSEGHVHHMFTFWGDLLRYRTNIAGNGLSAHTGAAYGEWIKDFIREDKPYDEAVRELLTASGISYDNPAVGFYMRDYGMQLDQMAVTTQVFLGTQVVCAQCHDHPFDTWSQMDYYNLAAFSYGMVTTNSAAVGAAATRLATERGYKPGQMTNLRRATSEILKPLRFSNVNEQATRMPRLPSDYQYDNAKPKQVIRPAIPAVIGGNGEELPKDAHAIEIYADWMTSPGNPRFTTVIVNRLWKEVFGMAPIEPVDEFTEHTEASDPRLMAALEKTIKGADYSVRDYLRVLFNTDLYSRQAVENQPYAGLPFHFPGPLLRRMSAEQVWDSIVTLTVDEPDGNSLEYAYEVERRRLKLRWLANSVYDQKPGQFLANVNRIAKVQGKLADEMEEISVQLAAARDAEDAPLIKKLNQEGSEKRRELVRAIETIVYMDGLDDKAELVSSANGKEVLPADAQFMEELRTALGDADGSGKPIMDSREGQTLTQITNALSSDMRDEIAEANNERRVREWAAWGVDEKLEEKAWEIYDESRRMVSRRASELVHPAPDGHFLRDFGQSDRELVDNANSAASVTQALQLLNGRVSQLVNRRHSTLTRGLFAEKSIDEKIDYVFLSILSRYPTDDERDTVRPLIDEAEGPLAGARDCAWALLNSRQFLFIE